MGPGDPPSSSMPNVLVIGTPFSFIFSGFLIRKLQNLPLILHLNRNSKKLS